MRPRCSACVPDGRTLATWSARSVVTRSRPRSIRSRDITVSEQSVALAFGANEFALDMVSRPETHTKLVSLFSDFLGRNVQLECQAGDEARVANPIGGVNRAPQDGPDPLVEYAVTTLGAKLVE